MRGQVEDSDDPLSAAKEAVNRAKEQDKADDEEEAERLYKRAASLYVEAGVDPGWFDEDTLLSELHAKEPPTLEPIWFFPHLSLRCVPPPERAEGSEEWIIAEYDVVRFVTD